MRNSTAGPEKRSPENPGFSACSPGFHAGYQPGTLIAYFLNYPLKTGFQVVKVGVREGYRYVE
jgi:hypothetical protein